MARREKLLLGSSLLHSVSDPCYFERFCLQHAIKHACTNHKTYVRTTDVNAPKMIPKWPQTFPTSILEGVWRPLGSYPWNKVLPRPHLWQILLHFWVPFGTSLGSFWASFFDVFLKWLFDGFGLHLGSQNTSNMRPKRGSNSKHENHWFC